jgi:hypothetical protein
VIPSVWAKRVRGSFVRLAEEETKHVQVVHAHVRQRQTVIAFEEGLPVRDGMHVDLGEDDRAKITAVEDFFQNPHRLVVAHVLVDREQLSRLFRPVAEVDRVLEGQRQRLLGENRLYIRRLKRAADQLRLLVGRVGDVEDLDRRIGDQCLRGVVNLRDSPAFRHFGGMVAGPRGDRDNRETSLLVGGEVALGHDHAGTDAADPVVAGADRRIGHKAQRICHRSPPSAGFLSPLIP